LGKKGFNICLIESFSELGGCHRVIRPKVASLPFLLPKVASLPFLLQDESLELFSEHGPRIYSSSFVTFKSLLNDMGYDFYKMFVPYTFQLYNIKYDLAASDILHISWAFIKLLFNSNYGKNITVLQFAKDHKFSEASTNYLDRFCRVSDGTGSDKYTLFQFLSAVNQQAFYRLYQPNIANDKGLIEKWVNAISKYHVDIITSATVTKINYRNDLITNVEINNKQMISANKFILAIPPKALPQLIWNLPQAFDVDNRWINWNSYNTYITMNYHWMRPNNVPNVRGFNQNDQWAIVFVIVSNYFDMTTESSHTIITASIGKPDVKVNGKTAHQYNEQELFELVFEQMKEVLGEVDHYDYAVMEAGVYREDDKWKTTDTGYIRTTENSFIKPMSPTYKNLAWVGTHNGQSQYYFTSIESAVSNAIDYVNKYEYKTNLSVEHPIDLTTVIKVIFLLIAIIIIYRYRHTFVDTI
jgi:hypothetical protein